MKNNKAIIIVIVLILTTVVFMLWAVGNMRDIDRAEISDSLDYTGELSSSELFYDFGEMPIRGGKVSHEFILSNESLAPVRVGDVWTSCMCTEAFLSVNGKEEKGPFGMPGHTLNKSANLIVNPGEKLIVRTEFDPATHGPTGIGTVEREIYLKVGTKEPLVLKFNATVTP